MSDQAIDFEYETYSGKQLTLRIDPVIDIRDFKGTAGFPLLVLAAATRSNLPIEAVWSFLMAQSCTTGCERVKRSRTYLQRRRWMFLPERANNLANRDGKDGLALEIIGEHSGASLRDLVLLLKERGVTRSREWVRRHRGVQVTHSRHN